LEVNKEIQVKGHKVAIKWDKFRDLMYSMKTTLNNIELYTRHLLSIDFTTYPNKRDERYVNFLDPGSHSTMYMYIKTSAYKS
jgi:hypothetical protein